jgi:hypothetical protein
MYSRSAKGGEEGDPNRNPWLAKMLNNMIYKKKLKILNSGVVHHRIVGGSAS